MSVKRKPISESEMVNCWKEVGGEHSTDDDTDNKTVFRKGSLLSSGL